MGPDYDPEDPLREELDRQVTHHFVQISHEEEDRIVLRPESRIEADADDPSQRMIEAEFIHTIEGFRNKDKLLATRPEMVPVTWEVFQENQMSRTVTSFISRHCREIALLL